MPFPAGLLLRVLAFGVLVVPAFAQVKFKSIQVDQCGPVDTTFIGTNLSSVPASVTILPLNSTPISIPLPVSEGLVSSGVSLPPLPLPAGSNFLASLDNAQGQNIILVSDLIRVLPSEDTGCLPNVDLNPPRRFSIGPMVAQCENMTIRYDTSVVAKAPSVRLYAQNSVSFNLFPNADDTLQGIATYTLIAFRNIQIMFLIDGGPGIQETSPLFTVAGDASSDTSCLKPAGTNTTNMMASGSSNTTPVINGNSSATQNASGADTETTNEDQHASSAVSKAVIIGCSAAGAVIFLIAVGMVIFVVKDRRARAISQNTAFSPSSVEKASHNEKPSRRGLGAESKPMDSTLPINPIYTTNSFVSVAASITGRKSRGSTSSRTRTLTGKQPYSVPGSSSPPMPNSRVNLISPSSPDSSKQSQRHSLESLDIEGMLNMATLQSENMYASRKNSEVSIMGPIMRVPSPVPVASAIVSSPPATFLLPETSRRQLSNIPSDVSPGPTTLTFTGYTINPFDNNGTDFHEPLWTGDSVKPTMGSLPTSPRDSGSSKMKTFSQGSDWYGVAQ